MKTIVGDYAHLKWRRYNFPEGNTYPIALYEGETRSLPFGIEGELLKVKVNSISESSIDLTIDQSNIISEIEDLGEQIEEEVEEAGEELGIITTYHDKIIIKDSSGNPIGYVQPYHIKSSLGNYAYLKYQRYGFPVGNTYPLALIEGSTYTLTFGIEGEILKVKIKSISSDSVDLDIDQSSLEKEWNENMRKMEEALNILGQRIEKWVEKGYHTSLHVVSKADLISDKLSKEISDKESELAEKIADSIIVIVIDNVLPLLVPGIPFNQLGIVYKTVITQIDPSLRHQITQDWYNIKTIFDNYKDEDLSRKGSTTIYIGNPSINKLSAQMNEQLKKDNLPYFDKGKIIGKRTYSESSIGMIASIPQEKVWIDKTLEDRWNNDRIRLYKVLIVGIGDEGTKAAAKWYNDQLDLISRAVSKVPSLVDEPELSEILGASYDIAIKNPKASISSATMLQGWILNGVNSFQAFNFERVKSLGYVFIVKKSGDGYRVLEMHSLIGDKKEVFLDPDVALEEIEEVQEEISKVIKSAEEIEELRKEIEEMEAGEEITGKVIEEIEEEEEEYEGEIEEKPEFGEEEPTGMSAITGAMAGTVTRIGAILGKKLVLIPLIIALVLLSVFKFVFRKKVKREYYGGMENE